MKEPIEIVRDYSKIPQIYRYTFWSTFFVGMWTHLYILTNKLPTFDDILCLNSYGGSFGSGRWFLGILGIAKHKIFGNYSMPMVNGMLAIFLIAIFACLVNNILENENTLVAILTGILLVVFPTIAGNMSFMFTGYYYSLAMVLLGIGILFIKQEKRVWMLIIGSFLLTLSLAIYQAYYPLAAGLFLIVLILDCFKEDSSFKKLIGKAFWYLSGLVIGLVFYFVLNGAWLKILHMEMGTHKGMDHMAQLSLGELLNRMYLMYQAFIEMLSENYYGMTANVWIRFAIVLLWGIGFIILLRKSVQLVKDKNYLLSILVWVFVLLFPIGIHSIYIMVESRYLYTLMIYADVLLFIFPLILCEKAMVGEKERGAVSKATNIAVWGTTLLAAFVGVFYIYQDNAAYLEAELSMSAAKSYYTTLITQIKSLEGYEEEMEVVLIGENQDSTIYEIRKEFFQDVEIGGIYETDRVVKGIDKEKFMKYYCGYDQKITKDNSCVENSDWQNMPDYPAYGSIKIVEDKIIVKFSGVE